MDLRVSPTGHLSGSIDLPASKSYSIRAFMVAACGGESTIIKPSNCDDARVALRVVKALGGQITRKNNGWHIRASKKKIGHKKFSVQESGTVLRLLLPLLTVRCRSAVVEGAGTLIGRPNRHLLETLRRQGVDIAGVSDKESVPITFRGGEIKAGTIAIDGSLSSQFVSAVLMTAPSLPSDSRLMITGEKIVSKDYITMTRQILDRSGITVKPRGERVYDVRGNQTYRGLKNFTVPSDYGLAAFLMSAACLVHSRVRLEGQFDDRFLQADGHILNFLKAMGAQWTRTRQSIVLKGPFDLKGGVFSLKDCPDLVPIMAVTALFAKGRTVLKNIHHARAKESDRISDLRQELLKVGANIREEEGALVIHPLVNPVCGATLDPHRDHRLAMAFAVLGLKIGVVVKNMECCSKSYPDFVRDFKALGALVAPSRNP